MNHLPRARKLSTIEICGYLQQVIEHGSTVHDNIQV